jgi:acetoacetate decarboxylase
MDRINSDVTEQRYGLTKKDVLERAFAIPLGNPAYPPAPDKFFDRPALTVQYRTDIDKARALVPEPLMIEDPIVSLTFLFMVAPGLGDYYEVSQGISVSLNGENVSFRPSMYASNVAAVLDGREIWGLPKKFGSPMLTVQNDTLVGTLEYSGSLVARATMGYRYREMDPEEARKSLSIQVAFHTCCCSKNNSPCGWQAENTRACQI